MSHFTVAVIADNLEKIEEMLEPYSENIEVEPYIYKTKQEIIECAKNFKEICVESKNKGKEITDWELEFINATTDEELYKLYIDDEEATYDEQGNELTTYNPNSKWDWYEIGGRWRDILLVKEKVKDCIWGRPTLEAAFGRKCKEKDCIDGYKWCNAAKIKDIEFNKMIEINQDYKRATRFWETYVEGQNPETEEEKEDIRWEMHSKEYYKKNYETKENFAKIRGMFSTWAFLDSTGWYEKGKMGYFAMNDMTKDSEIVFIEKFNELLNKPENQEKYLVIVDCHI